jgi:hypothetical protein
MSWLVLARMLTLSPSAGVPLTSIWAPKSNAGGPVWAKEMAVPGACVRGYGAEAGAHGEPEFKIHAVGGRVPFQWVQNGSGVDDGRAAVAGPDLCHETAIACGNALEQGRA